MSYLRIKFVVSVCCLSFILGAEKDFLDPANSKEISKEAFTSSEKDDNLNRQARQSFSFSTFQPFAPNPLPSQTSESGSRVGVSFQSIRMGPEEPQRVQQRQPDSVQTNQFRSSSQGSSDIARPRLTLNDLDFDGFEFSQSNNPNSIQRQPQTSLSRNRFQNFQTVTEPSRLRNIQPSIPSSQISRTQFSTFQQTQPATQSPRSRFTNFNIPPNSDPRRRNRVQPNLVNNSPKLQSTQATFSDTAKFQPATTIENSSNRRMRQRFRTVTRVPATRVPETRTPVTRAPPTRVSTRQFVQSTSRSFPLTPQNTIQESVRSFEKSERFDEDYEDKDDLLIRNCLKEAIKHSREIEELENRTALHIEYAQEKQLEILHLEETLENLKNESTIEAGKISNLENNIQNLTILLDTKDQSISKLKEDIRKLEETFEKEETKKHETLKDINKKLETTTIELAKSKISLDSKTKENKDKGEELDEALSKVDKFKKEKKNLLRIVQQLAEIGNPSLNFNTFSIGTRNDDYGDYGNYEQVQDYESELNTIENEYFEVDTSDPEGSGGLE